MGWKQYSAPAGGLNQAKAFHKHGNASATKKYKMNIHFEKYKMDIHSDKCKQKDLKGCINEMCWPVICYICHTGIMAWCHSFTALNNAGLS